MSDFRSLKTALLAGTGLVPLLCVPSVSYGQDTDAYLPDADRIVVRGARIPDEKRATSEISSLLDEDAFRMQGDSDIASALRRVTGLTLADGKFVFVRGLNERYSSVTLNGSPLPSPAPLRRIVPLDLVPTAVLSGTVVQKTYSPDYSGEFGGGVIDLRTKKLPDEDFFSVTLTGRADTQTSFSDGLLYDGGSRDWTGFDDGTRDMPSAGGVSVVDILTDGATGQDMQDAADLAIEQHKTLLVTENTLPPDWKAAFTAGRRFDLAGGPEAGVTAALSLENAYRTRKGIRQGDFLGIDDDGGLRVGENNFDAHYTATTLDSSLNGFVSAGVEPDPDHTLLFTGVLFRNTTKEARVTEGYSANDSGVFSELDLQEYRTDKTEFFERQVWQGQFTGEHYFPGAGDLSVRWRAAYGKAFRDSPYERTTSYITDTEGLTRFATGDEAGNPVRFSRVDDRNTDAGVDFSLPVTLLGNSGDISAGYAFIDKRRDSSVDILRMNESARLLSFRDITLYRADIVLSPEILSTDLIDYQYEFTGPENPNRFSGTLKVHGAYVSLDTELGSFMRMSVGGRFEDSVQSVATDRITYSGNAPQHFDPLDEQYFLPAVTFTWNPVKDLQVRAGFSQTITRPQFREQSPSFFINEDTDLEYSGNPFLVNSTLDNYDLRAEWYFSRGQFATLGFFYKNIENPIEEYTTAIEGDRIGTSFYNAPSARVYGLEAEFEKSFYLDGLAVSGVPFSRVFAGRDLVFKMNYTWSGSSVSADGFVTRSLASAGNIIASVTDASQVLVDGRPLQGQSDHIFNAQIGWRHDASDSQGTLLVNWASDRTRSAETPLGIVDGENTFLAPIVEDIPVTLDFVYNTGLDIRGAEYGIRFKVQNILGKGYAATRMDDEGRTFELTDLYDRGTLFSLGVSRNF